MKIKQFEVPGLAQYSYVLSSEGQAIVVDPMRDFDRYTEYAAEQGTARVKTCRFGPAGYWTRNNAPWMVE